MPIFLIEQHDGEDYRPLIEDEFETEVAAIVEMRHLEVVENLRGLRVVAGERVIAWGCESEIDDD